MGKEAAQGGGRKVSSAPGPRRALRGSGSADREVSRGVSWRPQPVSPRPRNTATQRPAWRATVRGPKGQGRG